ncbi:MAG TPA: gluconokinase [Actinoplanes sp.]|nr:gluconokinase [Actinoplanes sp.]
MDVVIGLDTGTTATKAVAAGLDGRVRALTSVGYPLLVPGSGRAELDGYRLREAAVQAVAEVAGQLRDRGDRVLAICLSAAMHGLVPLDADGLPQGPLITWADGRAAAQSTALSTAGRAAGLHRRTGTPVHPMSPLAKLAWWHETDPGLVRATARWGGVKDVVVAALCGPGQPVDRSCASSTGLYDIHRRRWDDEALDIAGVRPEQLAEVVPTTHRLAPLLPDVAGVTGLPADTPVIIGAADGPLANLGLGAVTPGVAAVSIGTSGALRTVVDTPRIDDEGRLFCFALTEDRWVVGGAVNNGGSVVRWAAQALAQGAALTGEAADALDAELLAEAQQVPAGSDGLLCLPYLLGERAPWWRAGLRGAYLGLRREHRRAHLVRAALEGVCQQLALVRDGLTAARVQLHEVRATGGAVASPLWVSTLASTLDQPVCTAASPEGTAVGACLLGLHALGALPDLGAAADIVATHEPVSPDPDDAALYRRLRPLVERSALAIADVLTDLDRLAPGPAPATEKAVH